MAFFHSACSILVHNSMLLDIVKPSQSTVNTNTINLLFKAYNKVNGFPDFLLVLVNQVA